MTYLLAHSLAREMLNSIAGIYMSLIAAMPSAQTLLLSFPSVTEAAAAPEFIWEFIAVPPVHLVVQASGLDDHVCWKPVSGDRFAEKNRWRDHRRPMAKISDTPRFTALVTGNLPQETASAVWSFSRNKCITLAKCCFWA